MDRLARHCGFKPWTELSKDEQNNVSTFISTRWPSLVMDASLYYWKESERNSGEWIAFDVSSPA
jgi:hypothetical protein